MYINITVLFLSQQAMNLSQLYVLHSSFTGNPATTASQNFRKTNDYKIRQNKMSKYNVYKYIYMH